jgi:short-subunit dehydrogenase
MSNHQEESPMSVKLRDAVVVITGASSGIGRATALKFAREGATVVVVARREHALRGLAQACEQVGGRALAIPCDVTDEAAVKHVAREAIEHFGRIDVWVNNAAVTAFGRFEEMPSDVFRQVVETNFFGYVYGARAVLPIFREQGDGNLINVSSMVGNAGTPYISAYSATKAAILAFAESIRMELRDAPGIHVCSVLPASIDTPLFQHAANYTGRAPKALNPVYDADVVADAIVEVAQHPKRERVAGNAGRMLTASHLLAPGLYERIAPKQVERDHFLDKHAEPTTGNLFEPMPQWTSVSGGWKANGGSSGRRKAVLGLGLASAVAGWLVVRPRIPALRR